MNDSGWYLTASTVPTVGDLADSGSRCFVVCLNGVMQQGFNYSLKGFWSAITWGIWNYKGWLPFRPGAPVNWFPNGPPSSSSD